MAPTQGQASDARGAHDPSGRGEAEGLGLMIQRPPGCPALGAHRLVHRINTHPLHTREIDHQAAVADRRPGHAVATPTDRDQQRVLLGELDTGAHVRHPALKVADKKAADGTCAVLLGVGDGASVQIDVSNTAFSDTPLACRRAGTVAGLVEPKLP